MRGEQRGYSNVAVLIPCYNEMATIAKVVTDFRAVLPGSVVYVYDNGSQDDTADLAARAGAEVRSEMRSGKGNVVRRMLADVEADYFVLVDGDDTYDPMAAPEMIRQLQDQHLDMVTAVRISDDDGRAYRRGHVIGNQLFTRLHTYLFGEGCSDVFSGYRVLSRRFAKSFPATATGFEIEAEMTAHALDIGAAIGESASRYTERPEGSSSKLRTYRDGLRILTRSFRYFKELQPLRFFTMGFVVLTAAALALGIPIVLDFADTGKVERLPTALLSVGIQLSGILCFVCGVILDSVARARRETKRLAYLRFPADPSVRHASRGERLELI